MWVPQTRSDVEPEVERVLYGGISQLDAHGAALLEHLLKQEGLQDRIELLLDILQENLRHQQRWGDGGGGVKEVIFDRSYRYSSVFYSILGNTAISLSHINGILRMEFEKLIS